MIVKKTSKNILRFNLILTFYKRKLWFWFTNTMLTSTNPFLEAGPSSGSLLQTSPEPWVLP